MRREALVLVAAVVAAGCTVAPSSGAAGEEPPAQGLIIKEAKLQHRQIPDDGDTELLLKLANTQPRPVKKVEIDITNRGGLSINLDDTQGHGLDDGKSDPKCRPALAWTGSQGNGGATIQEAFQGVPNQLLCVFNINDRTPANNNDVPPGTYPITVSVTYKNTLTMQRESPKITLDPDQQLKAAKRTQSYSNGELSLSLSYPPRIPADAPPVEVDTTVANTGSGRIATAEYNGCKGRCVDIGYEGSLLTAGGYTASGNGCDSVIFPPGTQSATATCTFKGGQQVNQITSHNLRANATYAYKRQRELPLRIIEQD